MKKLFFIIGAILMLGISGCGEQKAQIVTIGTGGVTGVYYPTGGAVSRMLNQNEDYNIKATVESTAGSVYNINAVLSGNLDFGIAQSDRQYQAYYGEAEWKARGPQKKLRSVFSIHPESITLVASVNSDITGIEDLKGKKVNLGNIGSGQLQNSKDILEAFGISEDEIESKYVNSVETPELIQDGSIDAFFYTVGHPSGAIKEASSGSIKTSIIPIVGDAVKKLTQKYPYYAESIIDIKHYPTTVNEGDVRSVGVKATLVTSIDASDKIVYAITKEVFENFDEFVKLHPAYSVLTKQNMLEGLSAPIHKGALKYYKETGLDIYINPNLLK